MPDWLFADEETPAEKNLETPSEVAPFETIKIAETDGGYSREWVAAVKAGARAVQRIRETVDDAQPVVSAEAAETALKRTEAEQKFAECWNSLTQGQRIYLRALEQTGFSHKRALSILNAATDKPEMRKQKGAVSRATANRWQRSDEDFKFALAVLKSQVALRVTGRDDLLLRAYRAAEYAEEEKPVLYQGGDTGYRERNIGEMIRANEQLMKATKVIGADVPVNSGTGPALVIQVVQPQGNVIDVTPRHVPIALPAPSGA